MPRKTNSALSASQSVDRRRRAEDVGADAVWKRNRAANAVRDDRRAEKLIREEKQ